MLRTTFRRALIPLLLIALAIAAVFGWRWNIEQKGRAELAAVVANLDATDPRWRWDDIEADQPVLRDEENAARHVAEFRLAVGVNRSFHVRLPSEENPIDPRQGPSRNCLPNSEAYRVIDETLENSAIGWPAIEQLAETPKGRCQLPAAQNWLDRRRPDEEGVGGLLIFLQWEAERLARDEHPDRQEKLALAYLNATQIDDLSPHQNSVMNRSWRLQSAARHVERVLALDRFGNKLARLQCEFIRLAEIDLFPVAVRLDRAEFDRLCEAVAIGDSSLMYQLHGLPANNPGIREVSTTWLYRPHLAADWAAALAYSTNVLAVAKLPDHDRLVAFGAILPPPKDEEHPFSSHFAKDQLGTLKACLFTKATLRCTAAALAVERHRLQTGSWPATLEAIPKSILPTIPPDPYTGQPLGYVRRLDGVTVRASVPQCEFRLFDPDQRRLPPPAILPKDVD